MSVSASATADRPVDSIIHDPFETLGLELALQDAGEQEFARAVESAGARMLFGMRIPAQSATDGEAPYVAALAVGEGDHQHFLIVTRPAGGDLSIEAAETSDLPIARIAPSFAAVLSRWQAAA